MILTLPLKAKKVLVIDDEINGITLDTALNEGQDLFNELRDINSPITDEITDIINNEFNSFSNFIENQNFSLELIQKVFLNKIFQDKLTDEAKELFYPLNKKNELLENIRSVIEQSFPKPYYEIDFLLSYEEANNLEIEKYDLLILDWFLSANVSNEYYLKNTLSEIKNLPPIILITSHSDINNSKKRSIFFEQTRISASGLTTLTKDKLLSSKFGSIGLSTISSTLINQRKISNSIRSYIKDWEDALDKAKNKTLSTLWQLDTFIIKSIQEDAIIDGQPYHDHFHNFIERENSWHIENEFDSKASIESLGNLLEDYNYSDILTHYTNENSVSLHRNILTHYSFRGYSRRLKISSKTSSKLRKNILFEIPFGAVLKPNDINEESEIAYINITQPCDLSNIFRSSSNMSSIVLLKMQLIKRELKESLIFDTSNYIITGFPINGDFYDLKPLPMSMLSNSFNDFYDYSVKNNLFVVGEVRYDIAVGLQQKAISHLIRPSQQRTQRPSISSAKIIHLRNCPNGLDDNKGHPQFGLVSTEYGESSSIAGTKDQKTNKQYIQLVNLDHFELTEWILSKIQNQNIQKEKLIDFLYQRIEIKEKNFEKKVDSLKIKFTKRQSNQSINDVIQTLNIDKNGECICIIHQANHL